MNYRTLPQTPRCAPPSNYEKISNQKKKTSRTSVTRNPTNSTRQPQLQHPRLPRLRRPLPTRRFRASSRQYEPRRLHKPRFQKTTRTRAATREITSSNPSRTQPQRCSPQRIRPSTRLKSLQHFSNPTSKSLP